MRILLRLAIYLIFFVAAAYLVWLTPPVNNYVKRSIENAILDKTGLKTSLEKISWQPPLTFTGHNIHIENKDGTTVQIKEAYIRPSIRELLHGILSIRALHLTGIHITLSEREKTGSSIDPLAKQPLVGFYTCPLEISDFRIKGIQITDDGAEKWPEWIDALNIQGNILCDTHQNTWSSTVNFRREDSPLGSTSAVFTFQHVSDNYYASLSIDDRHGGALLKSIDHIGLTNSSLKAFAEGKLSNGIMLPHFGRIEAKAQGQMNGDWEMQTSADLRLKDHLEIKFHNNLKGSYSGVQKGDVRFIPATSHYVASILGNLSTPDFGDLTFESIAEGPKELIQGHLNLNAPAISSSAKADFSLINTNTLTIQNIEAKKNGASISGNIQTRISPLLLKGDLEVYEIPLSLFSDLKGNVNGRIRLFEEDLTQSAQMTLESLNPSIHDLKAQKAQVDIMLTDAINNPKGTVELFIYNAEMKQWALGNINASTTVSKNGHWPFQAIFTNSQNNAWKINAEGKWHFNKYKTTLGLKALSGKIAHHQAYLQRPFKIIYEDDLLTLSPFILQVDEGTAYISLNEIDNGYELASYYLNLPESLLTTLFNTENSIPDHEEELYWNIKTHLKWQQSFDHLHFHASAVRKDSQAATTLSATLSQSLQPENLQFHWKIFHPKEGLLSLYSQSYKDLQLNSYGEWTIDAKTIPEILKNEILPDFSGTASLGYHLPQDNGQITTHVRYLDNTIRLLGTDVQNSLFKAQGSLSLDTLSLAIQGELHGHGNDIPVDVSLGLSGTAKDPAYTLIGNYLQPADQHPITFNSKGNLKNSLLQGKAIAETTNNDNEVHAEIDYQVHITDLLTSKIDISGTYKDKNKSKTSLGNAIISAHLQGPLKEIKGSLSITGNDLYIDDKKLPPWKLESTLDIHEGNNPFRISLENSAQIDGSWNVQGETISLQVDKAESQVGQHKLTLKHPWIAKWNGSSLEASPLNIIYGDGSLKIEAQGNKNDFHFFVKGKSLPTSLPLPNDNTFPLSGKLSLSGTLEGPWNSPQGSLKVTMEKLHLDDKFFGKTPYCHASMNATLNSQETIFRGEVHCPGIEPITLNAKIPLKFSLYPFKASLDKHGPLDISVKASGALGPALDMFLAHVNAVTGYLTLTLEVTGSLSQPIVAGHAALDNGSFENLETGTILNNISLKARAEGTSVTIEQLEATDGKEGRLTGQGTMVLDKTNNFPFEVTCKLDKMLLVQADFVRSAFNGNIVFKGNTASATIQGQVETVSPLLYIPEEIPEGTDNVDVNFVNIPEHKQRRFQKEDAKITSGYPVNIDLDIKTTNRLQIRGRGLQSAWKGQVHITGLLNNPQVQGEVNIIDGTYDFKGRIFELNQGSISFAGPWETKTKLYVIGALEIDDTRIEAILRGPLKNPSLAFRSNPPMAQKDIVSYLLFGKGASEISPYQGNQLSQSISNLNTQSDTPDILTKVRNRLRIDRLDINREVTSEGDKVSVQVGKYIYKNVYVSLNKSITDDSNSIAVDAKVSKHVRARAEITDNAETQLLLKWKHDF